MKQYILILMTWICASTTFAQIPRMLKDPWYQELKAKNKAQVNVKTDEVAVDEDHLGDVIGEMREAYNSRNWMLVDSLFEVARKEVPDHMNMFNWERTALRKLVVESDNTAEYLHKLMNLYKIRFEAGLPVDMPYNYGNNSQWNETQRLVDYTQYASRRIDKKVQYEYLNEAIGHQEKPLNAIVLCQLMDLTVADDMLSEVEYIVRFERWINEAHTTHDWLDENFLNMDIQVASNMMQALDQRESMMRKDRRVQKYIDIAAEAAEEERLMNSENIEERAQYYLKVGQRHISNKEYNKAVEALQKSIELKRDNAVAYIRLAECYTSNGRITGRVEGYLNKYCEQFAAIAALDMLRDNMRYVESQQGRNALTTQIDHLRQYMNQHPINRQDLFRVSMGYGDKMKLGSYINRTIILKERY